MSQCTKEEFKHLRTYVSETVEDASQCTKEEFKLFFLPMYVLSEYVVTMHQRGI